MFEHGLTLSGGARRVHYPIGNGIDWPWQPQAGDQQPAASDPKGTLERRDEYVSAQQRDAGRGLLGPDDQREPTVRCGAS